MGKWIAGAVAILLAVGGAYAFATGMISLGANSGVCMTDDEVPQTDRAAAEETALAIVKAMIANDDSAALAFMTDEARSLTPKDKFAEFVHGTNQTMGPFHDPKAAHVYLVDSAGTGPNARAICGSLSADRWVSLEIKPGLRQAHVVITANSRNNSWEYTVWLLPSGDGWRVQYIHLNASGAVGHSAYDLLAMARHERDSGHALNATVLYAAVRGFVDRGPSFQLGLMQTVNTDLDHFSVPAELQGDPPFLWTLNGKKYSVAQVSMIGIAGQLGLVFVLPRKTWPSDAQEDAESREFLDAFRAAHRDYAPTFSFLVARAMKPDNSGGFGTVL